MPWDSLRDLVTNRGPSGQRALTGGTWTPPVDVYEMPAEYVVVAELPGCSTGDFGITATATTLTLTGGRRRADVPSGQFLRLERGQGDFGRTFTFPEAIDVHHIRADLDAGLLTLRVPKAAAAQTRRIEIR